MKKESFFFHSEYFFTDEVVSMEESDTDIKVEMKEETYEPAEKVGESFQRLLCYTSHGNSSSSSNIFRRTKIIFSPV